MNRLPEKPPMNVSFNQNITISQFEKSLEFNKRYFYWSEMIKRVKKESEREIIWKIMKHMRKNRYKDLPFAKLKMKYCSTEDIRKGLSRCDNFFANHVYTKSDRRKIGKSYIISSLMEESIASSNIEGAVTTREIAKDMLRTGKKPKNNSERMILNNYKTMKYVKSIRKVKLTPKILLDIQKRITEDTLENPKHEGKFRNNDTTVVGHSTKPELTFHIPPTHKNIPGLVKKFCEIANKKDDEEFIHDIIKGIMLHFLIGYIHPFFDGNGRTARSIFYWYLLSKGYDLFEFIAISRRIVRSKNQYYLAYLYTEYDEMDLTYFIKYNVKCIIECLDDFFEYVERKQKDNKKIKEIMIETELSLRQSHILNDFKNNPNKFYTVKEIHETYNIVIQTARTDLEMLVKKEFIRKKLSGKTFVFSLKE